MSNVVIQILFGSIAATVSIVTLILARSDKGRERDRVNRIDAEKDRDFWKRRAEEETARADDMARRYFTLLDQRKED